MSAGSSPVLAVDTSVAIPLLLRYHAAHASLAKWRAGQQLSVCGHAWIETYAVLTRLPGSARVTPDDAVRLLSSSFDAPVAPRAESLARAAGVFASSGIAGGATYDGWVALAALDNGVRLASRDARAEFTYRRLGVDVEMLP